jgi:hypothetical protein
MTGRSRFVRPMPCLASGPSLGVRASMAATALLVPRRAAAAAPVGDVWSDIGGGGEDLRGVHCGLEPRPQGCANVQHGPA